MIFTLQINIKQKEETNEQCPSDAPPTDQSVGGANSLFVTVTMETHTTSMNNATTVSFVAAESEQSETSTFRN